MYIPISGIGHFLINIVERNTALIATASPRTAIAGDITLSGSIPLLNVNMDKNKVRGTIKRLEMMPLIKPINVSLVIPAEGRWNTRHKKCARIPKKAEKLKLSEKEPKMLFKRREDFLNSGGISPIWRIELILEPKDAPTSPRRSRIAGISTNTPGTSRIALSIFPSIEPAKASPSTVNNSMGSDSLKTLFIIFSFFRLGIFDHFPYSNVLPF